MKNMFFVVNKEKVYAYVVSILTIITLFFLSQVLNSDIATVEDVGTNIEQTINTQNSYISNENSITENNSNEQV